MNTINLYLDDERTEPEGWVRVTTFTDAVRVMEDPGIIVDQMSLDHDLGVCSECTGRECFHTGYKFALWCAEHGRWSLQKPTVHSMNPVGRRNILSVVDRYWEPPATSIPE